MPTAQPPRRGYVSPAGRQPLLLVVEFSRLELLLPRSWGGCCGALRDRAYHSIFLFARSGLWRKLSDWTEFLVRCSSRAESDSRGRAPSQWCGKVLRFRVTRSLPHFPVSHPAGSSGRLGQAQFPVSRKWLQIGSVVIAPRISKTRCQHFLRTSPCERRREVLPNQPVFSSEYRATGRRESLSMREHDRSRRSREMHMSIRSSVEMVVTQHAREGCGRRCAILFASELLVVCGRHTSPISGSHLFRDVSPEDCRNS